MNTTSRWKCVTLALGILAVVQAVAFAATTVTTVPVGYLKIDIAAGTLPTPMSTAFSIPLTGEPLNAGATSGRVTAVTSNKIKVGGAGWIAGALAVKAYPYAVRFTSGANAGLTLVITVNTTDTLTVATNADLTTLGITKSATTGDLVQIIPVDTLDSIFGSDTLIGSTTATKADNVYLGAYSETAYYYNTTLKHWVLSSGGTIDRGTVQIRPQDMVRVARVGVAVSLIFPGRVPETSFVNDIANSGKTYTSAGFPVNITLSALALQTKISGWVSASTAAAADTITILTLGKPVVYYYNGAHWLRSTDVATVSRDTQVITAGTPFYITRQGVAAGFSRLTVARSYAIQ